MDKIKVFMGIPSTGTRSDAQTYQLREIQQTYGDKIELVYPEVCTHRIFHDFARNEIVKAFLKSDCDVLWFLDSDIAPPVRVGELLTKHYASWELAGAAYPVFMTPSGYDKPQVVFCVYRGDENGLHAANVPNEGQAFVDGLATGCIFIKREVFTQLSEPYFEFKFDEKSRMMTEGEDLGFCRKVNELGYKFFTDFSIVCKHYKTVDLLELNNYAIEYANRSVLAYDAKIRPQVLKLAQKVQELESRQQEVTKKSKSGLILP